LYSCSLPTWKAWLRVAARMLRADAATLADIIADMQDRGRQRRALLSLDDRMLQDIGLNRADVWRELRKSSWRD
jgi:uncharacterized protein YjiS (DUF1127 family)